MWRANTYLVEMDLPAKYSDLVSTIEAVAKELGYGVVFENRVDSPSEQYSTQQTLLHLTRASRILKSNTVTTATISVPQTIETKHYHITYGKLPGFPQAHAGQIANQTHMRLFNFSPYDQEAKEVKSYF